VDHNDDDDDDDDDVTAPTLCSCAAPQKKKEVQGNHQGEVEAPKKGKEFGLRIRWEEFLLLHSPYN